MGWWDSLWPSSSGEGDPLRNLDPKLREFLEKESPVKYNNSNPAGDATKQSGSQSQQTRSTRRPGTRTDHDDGGAEGSSGQRQQEGWQWQWQDQGQDQGQEQGQGQGPLVPKESQFQDGRYAHLWKTYRPLAQVEAETKTDHEKLMDVLEAYKERKSQIGRAALENCALEQVDWRSCMIHPSVAERMTLCRTQVKKFERCYNMQTRFLKALGYLSTADRSPEDEEKIQMHADTLYHRMLAQEAEVEKAKDEGRPIPTFGPLLTPSQTAALAAKQNAANTTTTTITTTAQGQGLGQETDTELTPAQQETLRERLEKVPEEDRAAEAEAIKGEWRAKAEVANRVQDLWKQQERDRLARKERGEQTLWDRVSGVFGSSGEGGRK